MSDIKDSYMSPIKSGDAKSDLQIGLFEKDSYFVFLYKKTERVVSALYLVSNLFPENEPLRLRLREIGVALVTELMSLRMAGHGEEAISNRLVQELLNFRALLEISFTAGLVSEMNFGILKREIENLLETAKSKSSVRSGSRGGLVALDGDFFTVSVMKQEAGGDGDLGPANKEESVPIKDRLIHSKGTKSQEKPFQIKPLRPMESSRQSDILRLLKGGASLTMKDFSSTIIGCSEKTIQRELLKLVSLGVLNKTGERRWSRYTLSTPAQKGRMSADA